MEHTASLTSRGRLFISKSKSLKQDDSIMGTNNSSIVSKRSVERLYHADEPHFFRYFVKKPQRRSPLINRGYWLRMKAIDQVVRQFLETPSSKQKVVMNLGAGYDPLPWICMSRYPLLCDNVKFIDVDYKELMLKKRVVVASTPELSSGFSNVHPFNDSEIIYNSKEYIQIGVDLREIPKLSAAVASVIDLEQCHVLCTAEVSVTYMNVAAADDLIRWVSTFPQARFCILEQLLPQGIEHPFAKTMIAHFDKLHTPLRSLQKYPTEEHQALRFVTAGWKDVKVRNLWELWSSPDFLTGEERTTLNKIEPFDEWEDFAVFGCHYFILVANNGSEITNIGSPPREITLPSGLMMDIPTPHAAYSEYPRTAGFRRFAAIIPLRSLNYESPITGVFAGMGPNRRLDSCDVYSTTASNQPYFPEQPSNAPSARVCHTVTDLGDTGALLVGGRTSPDNAIADCWLYHQWTNTWERIDDLPKPRYRHCAVAIGQGTVLVLGGKSSSDTMTPEPLVWSRRYGWRLCHFCSHPDGSENATAVFGATAATTDSAGMTGLLMGGLSVEGCVSQNIWLWQFQDSSESRPELKFSRYAPANSASHLEISLCRFGAAATRHGSGRLFMTGGIAAGRLVTQQDEILTLEFLKSHGQVIISQSTVGSMTLTPRPLLIGTSTLLINDNLIIIGGGAVCFSFGTFWDPGCYTVPISPNHLTESNLVASQWQYLRTMEPGPVRVAVGTVSHEHKKPKSLLPRKLESASEFSNIVSHGLPVVFEGLNLGQCTHSWSQEYLRDHVGAEREVIVHQAGHSHMDFLQKNFEYVKMSFGSFLSDIESGKGLYLRSTSTDKPADEPANINRDFATIAGDFCLPPELETVRDNAHSSPLRISGPTDMWLHYDVMANVLCQIQGSKTVMLFPPSDITYFDLAPGASSSSLDVFNDPRNASLRHVHPHQVTLRPGDVLFIPPLWFHAVRPIDNISVSVNVFFRNLTVGYAPGKDVYGNRDLQAYEKGRQDIARIKKAFNHIPKDMKSFYLRRLADELRGEEHAVP